MTTVREAIRAGSTAPDGSTIRVHLANLRTETVFNNAIVGELDIVPNPPITVESAPEIEIEQ